MSAIRPLLIIGGGMHGTIISLALSQYLPRGSHAVLDPHPEPLWMWERNCHACGLRYLRSPAAHHLGTDAQSLPRFGRMVSNTERHAADGDRLADGNRLADGDQFASVGQSADGDRLADGGQSAAGGQSAGGDQFAATDEPLFIPRYNRPLLSLFMRHAHHLIQRHDLNALRIRGSCRHIEIGNSAVTVHTDDRKLTARRVILCIGATSQPCYPHWAQPFVNSSFLTTPASSASPSSVPPVSSSAPTRHACRAIAHVFQAGFCLRDYRDSRRVVIIGGGITALQVALNLRQITRGEIIVLSRHQLRYTDFDSDPCYLGPRCLREFIALRDPERRQERIAAARNRGSIPPDIATAFHACCPRDTSPACRVIIDEVARLTSTHPTAARLAVAHSTTAPAPSRPLRLTPSYRLHLLSGNALTADDIILATGFRSSPGAIPLLADLHRRYHLPTSADGTPMTDAQLRWHPRLLLSGGYAALTVGPAAGNIIGAHLVLRRIMPLLLGRPYRPDYAWKSVRAILGTANATR